MKRSGTARPWNGLAGIVLATMAPEASASSDGPGVAISPPARVAPEKPSDLCLSIEAVSFARPGADDSFSQLQQSVAALEGGGFGVVWEQVGSRPGIRLQWLDRGGRTLFPEGSRGLTGDTGGYGAAVIVPAAASGAFVAFRAGEDLVVQRFDALGEPRWPGEGVVAADRTSGQAAANPHLVADAGGGVFVCFQLSGAGPRYDIRCQRFGDGGERLWSNVGVSVGDGGNAELRVLPRGVGDLAGGLLLFWRNQREIVGPTSGPMLMEGQHFDPDGRRLWGTAPKVVRATRLAADNGYTYRFFQVVEDGSGGAILAFNDWTGGDAALDVMAQRVTGSGDLLWGEGAVVAAGPGQQQHEQTIATGDGGAFVAVFELVSGSHDRLRLFRLGPDGRHAWSPEGILVSDPAATALDYGVFGSLEDGVLRLAWTHQVEPASYRIGVSFATCSPGGALSPRTNLTTSERAHFLDGIAWSKELGAALAVWDEGPTFLDPLVAGGAIVREGAPCVPRRKP